MACVYTTRPIFSPFFRLFMEYNSLPTDSRTLTSNLLLTTRYLSSLLSPQSRYCLSIKYRNCQLNIADVSMAKGRMSGVRGSHSQPTLELLRDKSRPQRPGCCVAKPSRTKQDDQVPWMLPSADRMWMAFKRAAWGPCGWVPQSDSVVVGCRGQKLAVRRQIM